jgi:hypothetical protein
MDFEISNLKVENTTDTGKKAKAMLNKGMLKDELVKLFRPIREEIMSMEADQKRLAEDQAKREEAA